MGRMWVAVGLVVALLGCGDKPPTSLCPAPAEVTPAAGPRFDAATAFVRVGALNLEWEPTYLTVKAKLRSSFPPAQHTLSASEGACRQFVADVFRCDPECSRDALCTAENTCTPSPLPRLAGPLSVRLGDSELTVLPNANLYYSWTKSDDNLLAGCPNISVSAPGDDFAGFELSAASVPLIEITNLDELGYFRDEPLTIRWVPADPGSRVRVTLKAAGETPRIPAADTSIIECDVPDDVGEVTVPASMMNVHIDAFACAFCPADTVRRYRRVTVQVDSIDTELVTYADHLLDLDPWGNVP